PVYHWRRMKRGLSQASVVFILVIALTFVRMLEQSACHRPGRRPPRRARPRSCSKTRGFRPRLAEKSRAADDVRPRPRRTERRKMWHPPPHCTPTMHSIDRQEGSGIVKDTGIVRTLLMVILSMAVAGCPDGRGNSAPPQGRGPTRLAATSLHPVNLGAP